MRFDLPCGVLALVIGASAAQAQTVITGPLWGQPVGTVAAPAIVAPAPVMTAPAVVQPAETIQTIQTIRTVRAAPPPVRRQIVTTRTITRRVIQAAPAVVAGTVAAATVPAPAYDYTDSADYGGPIYDVAPAATVAPALIVAAPVAPAPVIYRYVYEPDRILVIDPTTNIAVQAIPR